jgi:hypothetical protein
MLVKLDFTNAFNSIRRDVMLKTVADQLPEIYRFCTLSYGSPTALQFGSHTVWSEEGAQQGDPLGPLHTADIRVLEVRTGYWLH